MHALLGENGAGKSTLVKCIMGFQPPTRGSIVVEGREVAVDSPRAAQALGIGMVYQHFTLVPSLTAAENLVIARADGPRVIDWRRERARLDAFLAEVRRVGTELVVIDTPSRPGVQAEEWQDRVLNDGSRHRIYKRYLTAEHLAGDLAQIRCSRHARVLSLSVKDWILKYG